jgi:hypothetical protein
LTSSSRRATRGSPFSTSMPSAPARPARSTCRPASRPAPCGGCHRLGRHMLVGARVLQHGGGVDAGLGGEGGGADIGRLAARLAVHQLVEGARELGQPRQRLVADADLEPVRQFGLELERRPISVTRLALPQRSPRPLSVPWIWRAPAARRRANWPPPARCRHGRGCRDGRRARPSSPRRRWPRSRAAACRRWCRTARPSARRPPAPFGAGQRIVAVGLVAVEEMLAIDHRLEAAFSPPRHAVGDALEVFLQRAAERDMDVIIPRLGDEADRVGLGLEQRGEAGIVGGRAPARLVMPKPVKAAFSADR